MALFALCVSGYEEYRPIWFRKDCTVDEFKKCSEEAISRAVRNIAKASSFEDKSFGYIDGNKILDAIIPLMKEIGFELVRPEIEIDLRGECLYRDKKDGKPEIIDDETWKLIIKNNAAVHKELHKDTRKQVYQELYGKKDK